MQEIGGAVEGIDNPDDIVLAIGGPGLFANDAMIWVAFTDDFYDGLFSSDIDLAAAMVVTLRFIVILFVVSLVLLSRGTGIRQ